MFIQQTFLHDLNLCDEIVDFFNNSEFAKTNKHPGSSATNRGKISTDLTIGVSRIKSFPVMMRYFEELKLSTNQYIKKYPKSNQYSGWGLIEGVNIQHYKPMEGYFQWHTERISSSYPNCARHLVFMTYLNDVTDKGETEFYHQNLKVSAERGKTVIWPADWTHTHRGVVSPSQDKYIITGWLSFMGN